VKLLSHRDGISIDTLGAVYQCYYGGSVSTSLHTCQKFISVEALYGLGMK
jgi:hypothetical protein